MIDTWFATILCEISTGGAIRGITVDNYGKVYFTNRREHIYQIKHDAINQEPQILVSIEGAKLLGIVWNENNNTFYVCDDEKHRIYSYSADTKVLTTFSTNLVGHQDGNIRDARFYNPTGIALDKNGDLYITEWHDVRKINLSTGTVSTFAGSQYGYQDGPVNEAKFVSPEGIFICEDGTIYTAASGNQCIRKIKDGMVSTVAGQSDGRWGHQDGPISTATFDSTKTVVADADGSLLVGDWQGFRKVDLNKQIVSTPQGIPSAVIWSLALSKQFGLFAGGNTLVMKLEQTWKWVRWIWVGHLKENPNECVLATLPRDVIKVIIQMVHQANYELLQMHIKREWD